MKDNEDTCRYPWLTKNWNSVRVVIGITLSETPHSQNLEMDATLSLGQVSVIMTYDWPEPVPNE